MAPMFKTRSLRHVPLGEACETIPSCEAMIEITFTRPQQQQFRSDKLSTFCKSEAFTFSSISPIEFFQL